MQVCVYPFPAISRIRPGTAVERRNAVCVYLVPAISRIRSATAVERRKTGLWPRGAGEYMEAGGER